MQSRSGTGLSSTWGMGFFLLITGALFAAQVGCGSRPRQLKVQHWQEDGVPYVGFVDPVFGGRSAIRDLGRPDGEVVLLVHGVGEEANHDWDLLIPALKDRYRVLVVDLPGFGRSAKGNKSYNPTKYARFLDVVVRKVARKPVLLVGHSMGGGICLRYAATHPEGLRRLVLVDVAGMLHREAFVEHMVRWKMHNTRVGGVKIGGPLTGALSNMIGFGSKLAGDPGRLIGSDAKRLAFFAGDPNKIAGFSLMIDDFSADLDNLQAKTMLVWGEDDPIAPLRTAELLQARLKRSRLYVISEAAHVPMKQQPRIFNRLLRVFFAIEAQAQWPVGPTVASSAKVSGAVGVRRRRLMPGWSPTLDLADRVGSCEGQADAHFEGVYASIHLNHCRDAVFHDVTTREIVLSHSSAALHNVIVTAGEGRPALDLTEARVRVTGGTLRGHRAVVMKGSALDLAGVRLEGSAIIAAESGRNQLIASLCTVNTLERDKRRYLHGYWRVKGRATLPPKPKKRR